MWFCLKHINLSLNSKKCLANNWNVNFFHCLLFPIWRIQAYTFCSINTDCVQLLIMYLYRLQYLYIWICVCIVKSLLRQTLSGCEHLCLLSVVIRQLGWYYNICSLHHFKTNTHHLATPTGNSCYIWIQSMFPV